MTRRTYDAPDGTTFIVPRNIRRVNQKFCGGWQVCYEAPTRFFADSKHGGTAGALQAAQAELTARYAAHPPEHRNGLRHKPLSHKRTALPPGISGPVLRQRPGRAPYAEFKVSIPRPNAASLCTSIYIATERTWSEERYAYALAKAQKVRDAAVKWFNSETKRAKK